MKEERERDRERGIEGGKEEEGRREGGRDRGREGGRRGGGTEKGGREGGRTVRAPLPVGMEWIMKLVLLIQERLWWTLRTDLGLPQRPSCARVGASLRSWVKKALQTHVQNQ